MTVVRRILTRTVKIRRIFVVAMQQNKNIEIQKYCHRAEYQYYIARRSLVTA